MSVRLCLEVWNLPPGTIAGVLELLVDLDEAQYRSGLVTRPPWSLVWVPDQPIVCSNGECAIVDESRLKDVKMLEERGGFGSCGELACAYAAWLKIHQGGQGQLQLIAVRPGAWHVTAVVGSTVYDPQVIGGQTHGVQ